MQNALSCWVMSVGGPTLFSYSNDDEKLDEQLWDDFFKKSFYRTNSISTYYFSHCTICLCTDRIWIIIPSKERRVNYNI